MQIMRTHSNLHFYSMGGPSRIPAPGHGDCSRPASAVQMDAYESARLAHGSATAPCLIEVHSVGHYLPSAQVGKMLLSSGTAQLGLLCYVPASKLDKCNASEWMRATLA